MRQFSQELPQQGGQSSPLNNQGKAQATGRAMTLRVSIRTSAMVT